MTYHQPVLLRESITGLGIQPGGTYVDATFGGGGHSREILKKLENGRLLAFDQDEDALNNVIDDEHLILINHNFRYLKNFLMYHQAWPVDGILADLGVSSHQFDEPERGFSIRYDGPLDLRMNRRQKLDARQVLNEYSEDKLIQIFRQYGELSNAGAIVRALIRSRTEKKLTSFDDLRNALQHLEPKGKENKFYAKLMQALRIEINQELEALKDFLIQSAGALRPGGRLVVIAYHSLEDRLVKNFIKTGNFEGRVEKDFYGNVKRIFDVVNKKPIVPGQAEIEENSRARSAKLRIAEKIKTPDENE